LARQSPGVIWRFTIDRRPYLGLAWHSMTFRIAARNAIRIIFDKKSGRANIIASGLLAKL